MPNPDHQWILELFEVNHEALWNLWKELYLLHLTLPQLRMKVTIVNYFL